MAKSDYIEYHLNPKKEVEATRHLSGVEYMEAILADMDISELSGCDLYHHHRESIEEIYSVEMNYDGWTNPDDE